jgi:uncharacterized protein YkwD
LPRRWVFVLAAAVAGSVTALAGGHLAAAGSDAFVGLVASQRECPSVDVGASTTAQIRLMLCLHNYARAQEGIEPLALSPTLDDTAEEKATRLAGCHEFSHTPCGDPWQAPFRVARYAGAIGENLALSYGGEDVERVLFALWIHSPPHRANILRRGFAEAGFAVTVVSHAVADASTRSDTVWVAHFGSGRGG